MVEEEYAHDPFPLRGKIGAHKNSHPMWYTPLILDYFKRHRLPVPKNIEFT